MRVCAMRAPCVWCAHSARAREVCSVRPPRRAFELSSTQAAFKQRPPSAQAAPNQAFNGSRMAHYWSASRARVAHA
eukprot:11193940-Lingulodinium_polyedra.AAC.2